MTDYAHHHRPVILDTGLTALLIGMAGLAATFAGWAFSWLGMLGDPGAFYRGWLFAWLFWTGISTGCMAMLMLYHCTGGRWGRLTARLAENAAFVLPLMVVLFVPLLFGLKYLYPWANPALLAHDPVLQLRQRYLNGPWFAGRSFAYLAIFSLIAFLLRRWSLAMDSESDHYMDFAGRQSRLSAGGLVVYFVLMTLASIDWIMSREAHWYSSVYGFITVIGQALSGMCFLLVMLWAMHADPPIEQAITPTTLNDEGNLLLMLVVLWAYLALSQLLVVWMGNLQADITWYYHRIWKGWRAVCWVLVIGHFLIPFGFLLKQSNKRNPRILGALALAILVLRAVDMSWMVLPSSNDPTVAHGVSWMDFTALVGIGGVWFATFVRLTGEHPLLAGGHGEQLGSVPHGTTTVHPVG